MTEIVQLILVMSKDLIAKLAVKKITGAAQIHFKSAKIGLIALVSQRLSPFGQEILAVDLKNVNLGKRISPLE